MGIWEFMGSAAEAVKRNAPPVKDVCKSSYNYSAAAFDEAVAAPAKNACSKIEIGQLMPDDETKSKMGVYGLKFAQNAGDYALKEGYKLIPGGVAFSKIIENTVNDVQSEKLKAVEENVGSSKKQYLSGSSEIMGRTEKDGKSPEDVIREFMIKDLFTTRFFDDMIVHETATNKGKKPA